MALSGLAEMVCKLSALRDEADMRDRVTSTSSVAIDPRRTSADLAFVPVERLLRPCVRLFAPLRNKVTPAARRSTQALLADRHLEHNTARSAVGEAASATKGN